MNSVAENLKLYIAVLDEFPDHMVPTLVAHAVLGAHFMYQDHANYKDWLKHSFKKVVLRVNQKEFNKILASDLPCFTAYESSCLNAREACIVVRPVLEYPNVIKFAKLWQPK